MEAVIAAITAITAIEGDAGLWDESGFVLRSEALDRLEFLAQGEADRNALETRIHALAERLEGVNARLFGGLRSEIRAGGLRGAALRERVEAYCGAGSTGAVLQAGKYPGPGYDIVDEFMDELLLPGEAPSETREREM